MKQELKRRECDIQIKLEPCGGYYLSVAVDIQGERLEFMPASSMAEQFGAILSALYSLFVENDDSHREWHSNPNRRYLYDENSDAYIAVAEVEWDNEGTAISIVLSRPVIHRADGENDFITLEIAKYGEVLKTFRVRTKDLCYAVAKACTDVLKQYGFYGYRYSTEHDFFNIYELLYIKSFALSNFEARELEEYGCVKRTSFEKEIELLLFDM